MTLVKQILILLGIILWLVFIGILNVSLTHTQTVLVKQLNQYTKNTAKIIGIALKDTIASDQHEPINQTIRDIIKLKTPQSVTVLIERSGELIEYQSEIATNNVPTWFKKWQVIDTPPAEFAVMSDWSVLAWVHVKPGKQSIYLKLWSHFLDLMTWFGAVWVILLVVITIVLRWALAPMKRIADYADSIKRKRFGTIIDMPATQELSQVAMAMNDMSITIKQSLDEQLKLAARLRIERDQDEVTQLGNRRYFDTALNRLLSASDDFLSGAVCLIELANFKDYNDKMGFAAGDDLLRRMATLLSEVCQGLGETTSARLGGGHFGVLLQDITCDDASEFVGKICQQMNGLYADGIIDSLHAGHVGLTCFVGKQVPSQLLAQADTALRSAQRNTATNWHLYQTSDASDDHEAHNSREWLAILRIALDQREVMLFYQPVVGIKNRQRWYREVYARIQDDQQIVPANLFIPMAERHGIIHELDQLIASSLFTVMQQDSEAVMSINLSLQSINNTAFVDWLVMTLSNYLSLASRLVIEIPEYSVSDHLQLMMSFFDTMRGLGCKIALDNFGVGMGSFAYLNELRPDYIKIDGSFTKNLQDNKNHQFFIQSIANVAHSLGIEVIAQRVESPDEWKVLKQLQVDAIQGYLTGEPRATA